LEDAVKHIAPIALLVTAAACGGSSGPAAAPTPPPSAPTISTSNDIVFIGQTVTFSANGTTPVSWGSDERHIISVDEPSGRVTGVGNGTAVLWAKNAGGKTTRTLRGAPSYNGSWQGSYAITGCQSTGGFALGGFCGSFFSGQILTMQWSLAQPRLDVTGVFTLGSLGPGALGTSSIDNNGDLPMTGEIRTGTTTIFLDNARLSSPTPGTMTGRFDQVWGDSTLSGTGRLICEIRNITRSSGAPALSTAPSVAPRSFKDAISAVLGR
jgi:hypothetical protein